ncbi:MAG: site-specific DNA-methyltransferase [Thermodesulfobacteriota bacterium]
MPRGKKKTPKTEIDTYTHNGKKRKNNPPVGLVSTSTDKLNGRTKYQHDPHIDPTLSWAGKKEGMNVEVQNVSLHIHERIDPSRIVKSFLKPQKTEEQLSLFDEPENNPPLVKAIDFYRHEQDWTNRLIAGDSLLVMNSLLVKEGMAGKVQMIYIDPPYGIKYNSNFQPFVNKRDVKDGNDADIPAEPEMIQAFRDTWELEIHSYLTHLRDRLLLARELLNESGSVFVQISDENVHHVREICDEVFGVQNFCNIISFQKTGSIASNGLGVTVDFLVWYAKDKSKFKYHQLYTPRREGHPSLDRYDYVESKEGKYIRLKVEHIRGELPLPEGKRFGFTPLISDGAAKENKPFLFNGETFFAPPNKHWKTDPEKGGLQLVRAGRIAKVGNQLWYKRYVDDFPFVPMNDRWESIQIGTGLLYVVQTAARVIERCLLMTTDPGDLVLDITCGSGTTAFVGERWGRRWITCDTSRVAITLAKQRLMTAKFDYFELAYPEQGIKSGFKYKTVPHVTLKSIANNEPPAQETLYDQPFKVSGTVRVTGPFTVEAVPSLRVKPFDGNLPKLEVSGQELARIGETGKQAEWRDELKSTGIRAVGGRTITFSRVEPMTATRFLHARAEVLEKDGTNKLAYISFGPDYGPLEQRQAEAAITEARSLKEKPDFVIFAAFHFDPEASKDIDQMDWPGVTILKAQMSVDLLTTDLRKKRSSNQSYWLIGQPDVEVKKQKDGRYLVKLHGFDYYDPTCGEIISKGTKHIAMWFLDTDYDERSLMPDQVFFPEGDKKRDWTKLAKVLKSEVNEDALEKFSGVESIPFSAGDNNKIAVKIIDNRGIESFVIKELE